jgi:hypothetical protein
MGKLRSESIARLGKKPEQDKDQQGDRNVNRIQHDSTISANA